MRAALYARVSTTDQHPEAQLHALREYATRRGLDAVEFVDEGQSGRKDSRPALDRLVAATRRREVDLVVCQKLDRIGRSARHLANLVGDLESWGVDLVVLDEAIDTTTPTGKLLFHVLGAIAEFEADLIRERTMAGLEVARRNGKRLGRPPALVGRQLTRARRLAGQGQSVRKIADQLGVSKSAVHRALREGSTSSLEREARRIFGKDRVAVGDNEPPVCLFMDREALARYEAEHADDD